MKTSSAFSSRLLVVLFVMLPVGDGVFGQKLAKNTNHSKSLKSAIFSGAGNLILSNGAQSFIGGGNGNTMAANVVFGTIAGGFDNAVIGHATAVGGGGNNLAQATYSVVAGGRFNEALSSHSTVGGGLSNSVSQAHGTIAGGVQNTVGGAAGVIAGGGTNTANGTFSSVGGGSWNNAVGAYSVVPGGSLNVASGAHSFAAGTRAQATNDSSFVWNGWTNTAIASTNSNSFTVRAPGGARFITATNLVGAILASGATAWAVLSDSNAKTAVEPLQPREILKKVAALPVTSWRYKHDPQRRYIGPMAQDFHEAFGLGADAKTISALDTDGVTLAAIQGLVEEPGPGHADRETRSPARGNERNAPSDPARIAAGLTGPCCPHGRTVDQANDAEDV